MTIPRVIYYTTDLPLKENFKIYDIIKKNSSYGFKTEIYDTNRARKFIQKHFSERHAILYDQLIPVAFKSDFFRYCIIYVNGGVYLDLGIEVIHNLNNLINNYDIVLVKDRPKIALWQGCILAKPKNKLFLKCINNICFNISNFNKTKGFLRITGSELIGNIFKNHYNIFPRPGVFKNKIKILKMNFNIRKIFDNKNKYFNVKKYDKKFRPIYLDELRKTSNVKGNYCHLWNNNKVFLLTQSSWIKSSRNYKIENNFLICECKDIKGNYIKNKIKLVSGKYNFVNINGILTQN